MTSLDLQAELERWINFNVTSKEPIDWFSIISEMAERGITGLEIRQELKTLGFIIDDYGTLQKKTP